MTVATSLKTPLRYPGGKSRAIKKMAPYFPNLGEYDEYREPFLGGGSVALHVAQTYPNISIWVNDLYEPLYTFWKQLQISGTKLTNELRQLKSRYPDRGSARGLFLEAREYLNRDLFNSEPFHRAISFYVVNKCSFSGLTESSSFSAQASDQNFTMRGIEKLPYYSQVIQKWHITNLSYEKLMTNDDGVFLYLDPPYSIKDNLYGKKGTMHSGFSHETFHKTCDKYKVDQMISYNSDNLIKERFQGWKAQEYDHTYTMRSVGDYMKDQQKRKELILLNY
ncbi:MAG: restriction endonuclease subunit M [Caudoviricetes sp.]|nr:MAG: restriction endonuclease subunit M [Caudoviricetes sp.]